jgi:hypothetical protein
MTMLSRMLLATLVVCGVLCAVFSFRPDWAEAAGLDLWKLPSLQAGVESELRRSDELDAQLVEAQQRVGVKQQVVGDVIDGRLDLLEAAARFRDLTPPSSDAARYLRRVYAGPSDDERFCRALIQWVRGTRRFGSRAEADRAAARLEAEFQERLRRHGRIALPPAPVAGG